MYIIKKDFFLAFIAVFQESFTISNIQRGFREAGITSFDPQYILDTFLLYPITVFSQGLHSSTV
jgi:hypothetical protein